MNITSAQAAKTLKKLSDDLAAKKEREKNANRFRAAVGEDVESVRPSYDFASAQAEIDALEAKIRRLKHAVNLFNVSQVVPGFDMTIDEMLVRIPQLTARKAKLSEMRTRPPKARVDGGVFRSGVIDYEYANYDHAAVEAEYGRICETLSQAQLALDRVNSDVTFAFDEG